MLADVTESGNVVLTPVNKAESFVLRRIEEAGCEVGSSSYRSTRDGLELVRILIQPRAREETSNAATRDTD